MGWVLREQRNKMVAEGAEARGQSEGRTIVHRALDILRGKQGFTL